MRKCPVTIKATDNPKLSTIKKNVRGNQPKNISSLTNIKSGIHVGVCKKKKKKRVVKSRAKKRV